MTSSGTAVIELCEHVPKRIAPDAIPAATGQAIWERFGDYVDVHFPTPRTDYQWELTPGGWAGFLPMDDVLLQLTTKVPISNLFGMLEVAYKLEFRQPEGLVDLDSMNEMFERLALVLARMVMLRARKGLYRTYCRESSALQYVRGRIDMNRASRRPWDPALLCHYEDHTTDVDENRLILWTLMTVIRSGICSARTLPEIRQAYRILRRFAEHHSYSSSDCVGRVYNRLNEDYEPMHGLCRFFLDGMGPTRHLGENRTIPFVINMSSLFEEFVARWLQRELRHSDEHDLLIQESRYVEGETVLNFRMDLVFRDRESGRPVLVADTKYKVPRRSGQDDINQMVAYAQVLGCSEAVLIYPRALDERVDSYIGNVRVRSVEFDVQGTNLESAGRAFLERLLS